MPSYIQASNIQDCVKTAIEDDDTFNFRIYPNPIEGKELIVQIDVELATTQLDIINVFGQNVYQNNKLDSKQLSIDVSEFVSGVYIVILKSDGTITKQRLLKK